MSKDWSFTYLVSPGSLNEAVISGMFDAAVSSGLRPAAEISGMTGDGLGSVLFSTLSAAMKWLCTEDGLISLYSEERELAVSIHRVNGILPDEMAFLPDVPRYDEVQISPQIDGTSEGRRFWSVVEEFLFTCASVVDAEYCYGINEDALEATSTLMSVHNRIAAGELPLVVPWLTLVQAGSPFEPAMADLAAAIGRSVENRGNQTIVRLTQRPWEVRQADIVRAAQKWMAAET